MTSMILRLMCIFSVILGMNFVIGQSLARFKTVTMSSQNGDWAGSRAVDGNYGGNPNSCGCCAGTSKEPNVVYQWIEIDLGETQTFTRIVVHGRTDNNYARENLIGLAVYLDDSFPNIASIPNTGQGHVRFHNFDLDEKRSAKKIKLVLERDDSILVICEVDVFNDFRISKGTAVTMSSSLPNWDAARAVDGRKEENTADCQCCASTENQTNPWLNVDLGNTFLITYIQMHGRTDEQFPEESFEGIRIEVDGTPIHTIPTGTHIDYYEVFPGIEQFGRQIRLTSLGPNRLLVMCELVIYGERVVSMRRNVQMSTQFRNWTASGSVDGDYRTLPGSCCWCASTNHQTNPWLRVDLGSGYTVSRVVIYGRTDKEYSGQSFSDMTIRLDTKVVHTIPTSTEWIHFYGFQMSSVQQAASVTLTLVGSNKQLVVCELVVYGECEDGRYGQECAMSCSPNCKEDHPCNHINGHCDECKPGYTYTDVFCRTICLPGTFGSNCQNDCGMCKYGDVCDRRTGECPNGCSDGYLGELCLTVAAQSKESDGPTYIGIPVFVGSILASVVVTFTCVFTLMFWKLRQQTKTNRRKETAQSNALPIPNQTTSNYGGLQLSTIVTESAYDELQ